jgi:transposase-like protein
MKTMSKLRKRYTKSEKLEIVSLSLEERESVKNIAILDEIAK